MLARRRSQSTRKAPLPPTRKALLPRLSPTFGWLPTRSLRRASSPRPMAAERADQPLVADHPLHGKRRRKGHRVGEVGLPVREGARAGRDRLRPARDDERVRPTLRRGVDQDLGQLLSRSTGKERGVDVIETGELVAHRSDHRRLAVAKARQGRAAARVRRSASRPNRSATLPLGPPRSAARR